MKRMEIPQKLVYEKFARTRNCRRKFIKNLLPEKRKQKKCKPNNRDLNWDWIRISLNNSFEDF